MKLHLWCFLGLWFDFLHPSVQNAVADQDSSRCPAQSSSPSNAVILSATGRVGSSNLLEMLGSHHSIRDIGEIFISSRFRSSKLPPNYMSPHDSPASSSMKQRLISHIKRSFSSNTAAQSSIVNLASVKFWHAWENVSEILMTMTWFLLGFVPPLHGLVNKNECLLLYFCVQGVHIQWMMKQLQSCG